MPYILSVAIGLLESVLSSYFVGHRWYYVVTISHFSVMISPKLLCCPAIKVFYRIKDNECVQVEVFFKCSRLSYRLCSTEMLICLKYQICMNSALSVLTSFPFHTYQLTHILFNKKSKLHSMNIKHDE